MQQIPNEMYSRSWKDPHSIENKGLIIDKQGQTKGIHSYLHITIFVNTKSLHLAKEIL